MFRARRVCRTRAPAAEAEADFIQYNGRPPESLMVVTLGCQAAISSSQVSGLASGGMRQSPRGERELGLASQAGNQLLDVVGPFSCRMANGFEYGTAGIRDAHLAEAGTRSVSQRLSVVTRAIAGAEAREGDAHVVFKLRVQADSLPNCH